MRKTKILFLLCLFGMLGIGASAYDFSSVYNGVTIYYEIVSNTDKTVRVTSTNSNLNGNSNYTGNITIPSNVSFSGSNYKVERIGFNAFKHSTVKSITLPSTVLYIENQAFLYCYDLVSINLPNSLKTISRYSFGNCWSLKNITIPSSVNVIGESAFEGCSSITNITIPSSVTQIGSKVFAKCGNLTSINVDTNNSNYYSENGILYNKTKTSLIECPSGFSSDSFVIPNTVTYILKGAFYDCNKLVNITIPSTITSILDETFYSCNNLKSIEIPNSVTSIGKEAFAYCENMINVSLPNSVATVGENAFVGCKAVVQNDFILAHMPSNHYGQYSIKEGIRTIVGGAFWGSNLSSIRIPNSVISIGNEAFRDCSSLVKVEFSLGCSATLGDYVFRQCTNLKSIEVPNTIVTSAWSWDDSSIKNIGIHIVDPAKGNPFYLDRYESYSWTYYLNGESLEYLTIPDTLTEIKSGLLYNCTTLSEVQLPRTLEKIGADAFYGCSGLKDVKIPKTVTNIGDRAFFGCTNLADVYNFAETPQSITSSTFSNYGFLHVSKGLKWVYEAAELWSNFTVEDGMKYTTALNDGEPYLNETDLSYDEISFTREFNNTNWQSLYVPFEIPLTEELLEEFDFAYINGAKLYDWDDDGIAEDLRIEVFKMKSGTLRANMPYLIRAKVAGEKTITVNEATLYATEENSIDCSTTSLRFTFTGGYQTLGYDDIGGCYLLGGGTWNEVKEGGTMKPMRFYLRIDSRDYQPFKAPVIHMTVFGEDDEVTDIQSPLLQEEAGEAPVFDLQGRRVEHPEKGIYIINGKKVIVK
ncbi:MAG: leucine-rich repeat domain-containing protein [Bacteroidaceae bacterium]|nr:leucine-rich repeat domain-containing protein [Bacteroidaceae bacterium]